MSTRCNDCEFIKLSCTKKKTNEQVGHADPTPVLSLPGRPVEEVHNEVALGSARPPITLINSVERRPEQQELEKLGLEEMGSRCIFL